MGFSLDQRWPIYSVIGVTYRLNWESENTETEQNYHEHMPNFVQTNFMAQAESFGSKSHSEWNPFLNYLHLFEREKSN
jgi:hypothetical protein